jgi:hypothetical protein
VPAGDPEGGQWTSEGRSPAATLPRLIAARTGRVTFSGYLLERGRDPQTGERFCLYFDSREQYVFKTPAEADGYCISIRVHW